MSTLYYKLRSPFTGAWLEHEPACDRLRLTQGALSCGTLTLKPETGRGILLGLCETTPCFRTYWGGLERGCCVETNPYDAVGEEVSPADTVVDEYGDVWTAAAVLKKQGKGRDRKVRAS